MNKERQKRVITPQQILLSAFGYFQTDRLDVNSLVNVGVAAQIVSRGSTGESITQQEYERLSHNVTGVLSNLVDEGLLTLETDTDEIAWYSVPPTHHAT